MTATIRLPIVALGALLALASAAAGDPSGGYRVVSEDSKATGLSSAVRLDARLSEAELKTTADTIRAKRSAEKAPRTVDFFLPAMSLGDKPWAQVRFDPEAKVTIFGLRLEEEIAFRSDAAADPRPMIGVWLTSPPALPGRLAIWREKGGKIFAEWSVRSGQKTVDEVIESKSQRGRRFEIAGSDGGYYLALWNGALELGDKAQVIAIAEKLNVPAVKAANAVSGRMPAAQAGVAVNAAVQQPPLASASPMPAPIASAPKKKFVQKARPDGGNRVAPTSKTASNVNDAISGVYGN